MGEKRKHEYEETGQKIPFFGSKMGSCKFDSSIDDQKGMGLTGATVRTVHDDTDTVC
jgi:hypothetical protein